LLATASIAWAGSRTAHAEMTPKVAIGKDGWLFSAWEDLRVTSIEKSRRVAQIISTAASLLRSGGIETVICMTPMKARIYSEFLPPDFQPNPAFAGRYSALLQDWRRDGILVPDLATYFLEQKTAQREVLYFKADIHWTPSGADLAGIEFAKEITEKHILPPSAQPGLKLGPYFVTRYGQNDLARLLPESEFSKYPFQNMRLRRPVVSKTALTEDDQADVMVLGNSYMQADYTFPTVLSNQLNRPVGLLWKPGGGPFSILVDYLNSPQFRQSRPRLLVWHVMEGNMEIMPDHVGMWGPGAMPAETFLSQVRTLVARR
jgi:alginate O-acetyltransferase complex protein AlgJ